MSCSRAACLAVVSLILIFIICFLEMQRDFFRVAPEEKATYDWIGEKGGTVGKEGKDRHIFNVSLADANVSDSELERLLDLTRLRQLDLSGTQITDAGLRALAPLTSLEYLDVSHTNVTLDGINVFTSQHPQLKMVAFTGIDE